MSASTPWKAPAAPPLVAIAVMLCAFMCRPAVGSEFEGKDAIQCSEQPSPREPLSLTMAVDRALCNNPQIRASWAVIRQQNAVVGEANAQYWPTLGATVEELHDRTSYPGSAVPASERTGDVVYAALDWRLFDFGGRRANQRAAESQLAAAVASKDATIQKIFGEIAQTYIEAVSARGLVQSRREAESIAQETLASAQRRVIAGEAARGDVLQSATALAKASLARNQAEAIYGRTIAQLAYLTALPPDQDILLPQELSAPTGINEDALTTWLEGVEHDHPAIIAARAAVNAAREHVSAVRSVGLPTVDLISNYYRNGFPNQGLNDINTRVLTVGISVNIPIFDGWSTRSKIEEARALVKIKESELEDTERSALMAVVSAHADATAALRNLHASENLSLSAQQSFESAERRYNSGAGNILELLSIQASRADAEEQGIRCIGDWHAARLMLLAAAGRLDRAAMKQ